MESREMFKQLSKLRTSDLLVAKMNCTKNAALVKALKLADVGLLGIFVAQLTKVFFSDAFLPMELETLISLIAVLYTSMGYLVLNSIEATWIAEKELICDLLSLRANKSGKKS